MSSMDVEKEIKAAGGCGVFQLFLVGLVIVPIILVGMTMVVSIFTTMTPKHYCNLPDIENFEQECNQTWSFEYYSNFVPNDANEKPSTCERYHFSNLSSSICNQTQSPNTQSNTTAFETVGCTEWIFNQSIMHQTVVTEFNLVCGSSGAGYISQSVFMLGVLIGSILAGAVSDVFGRRKAFLMCGVGLLVFGTAVSFSQSYIVYTILVACTGCFGSCIFPILFILGSEFMVVKHRATFQQVTEFAFTLGLMLLSLLAFFVRDWRHLQLTVSVPALLTIPIWWILPESPRWLLVQGRRKEAKEVLNRVRRLNGSRADPILDDSEVEAVYEDSDLESKDPKSLDLKTDKGLLKNAVTLMRLPGLRRISFIQFYEWFAVSCVYYGLTLNAASLGGDPFSNLLIASSFEVIANFLTIPLVNYVGRTPTATAAQILAGCFCIAMPYAASGARWLYVGASVIGKFFISMSFSVVYIHTSEIYPTPIRSFACGLCSAWARVGGIASPLIAMLGIISEQLPYTVFGTVSILSGVLCSNLPDTRKQELTSTLEEGEEFVNTHPGLLWKLWKEMKTLLGS